MVNIVASQFKHSDGSWFFKYLLNIKQGNTLFVRGEKSLEEVVVFYLSVESTLCVKRQFSSLFLWSKLLLSVLKMASVGLKAGIIKSYQGINLFRKTTF